jgi:hypothetical protein
MKYWIAVLSFFILLSIPFSEDILLGIIPLKAEAQNPDEPVPIAPVKPSLWWQSDRLGQGLIEDWSIDQDARLIKLQINNQAWLAADYVKRYAIMQKLGAVAQAEKYDIFVQNNRLNILAEYKYLDNRWQITPPLLGTRPFSANNGIFFGLR